MTTPLTMRDLAPHLQPTSPDRDTLSDSLEAFCNHYGGDGALIFKIRNVGGARDFQRLACHEIDPVLTEAVMERATNALTARRRAETLPMMIPAWRIGGASAFIYAFPDFPEARGQLVTACLSVERKSFEQIADMYLASRCMMANADLGADTFPGQDMPRISTREEACLAWTAEGKTSEEIGIILELSPHTVNHYLGSAARKLGATNRMHAVAKALRLGLIERPV